MSENSVQITPDELAKACAVSTELFGRTFFPELVRQKSPPFHREINAAYDNHSIHYLANCLFRGSAKTTLSQINIAKRTAYAVTHTGAVISASVTASERLLRWVKAQIENNKQFTNFYGLRKGNKWTEHEFEIINEPFEQIITWLAVGLFGSIRGVNIGGYRPDFLLIDDVYDSDEARSPEQRKKIEDQIFSSVLNTLAPVSEAPNAKAVINQTPLWKDDLIALCLKDKTFHGIVKSVFDENGESRWPERWTTDELLRGPNGKQAHVDRNQILLWLREKEVTIGDSETALFKGEWLQFFDIIPLNIPCVIAIDPVPPPSDRAIEKDLRGKDWEVIHVWGLYQGNYYLLASDRNRGHDPDWTIARLFEFVRRFRPLRVVVDGTAYQRTLKWIIEKAQKENRTYFQVIAVDDKRSKAHKITQGLSGPASQRKLHCRSTEVAFIEQFSTYPNVDHDDELDSAWMGIVEIGKFDHMDNADGGMAEDDYKEPLRIASNVP